MPIAEDVPCAISPHALAETINGLYKAKLIDHRLLKPIGYIPPTEVEANYYRQLASQATVVEA